MRLATLLLAVLTVGTAVTSVRAHAGHWIGNSCSTIKAADQEDCCKYKVETSEEDKWCENNYPQLFSIMGSSCATVTPGDNRKCCKQKIQENEEDEWCMETYPGLYKPDGSSCSTVTPGENEACCKQKISDDVEDTWCMDNFPELYNLFGSSCATVTPGDNQKCCEQKVEKNEDDEWCMENYPWLYETDGNAGDYPWMAYIISPSAANGSCAGSLIAPGYVLTAAQCVFKDGQAADAANVTVWVGGKTHSVETVLVNSDKAQFAEFQNPKSENSWDVAMLALSENSEAQYVALPLSDVPKLGEWIDTTAWDMPGVNVATAKIPVWDGCPPGWADEFCAGGGGFLQYCPDDKGSPAMAGNTQVGLTSGPDCDGTSEDYGYFLKLSDKGILEQITVWLNNRGTTGLDENIQNWLIEANTYLYERK